MLGKAFYKQAVDYRTILISRPIILLWKIEQQLMYLSRIQEILLSQVYFL